jgi:hydrocephalus-inducing protein
VVAESCVPGINTQNFESIFEEQIVVPSLTSGNKMMTQLKSNVFSVEEKTFYFGSIIPSKHPNGIVEKFKITNIHKIPCEVNFDVQKRQISGDEDELKFEIEPQNIKINPHEHRYVNVRFHPDIMTQYAAIFTAKVVNGEQNPKTHMLQFDLRGEGVMPTLRLDKPTEYIDDTKALLQFGKVRVGRTTKKTIIMRNDGSMPGTAKFELTPNPAFRFVDQASFTLSPGQMRAFNIEFNPKKCEKYTWDISVRTLLNDYEKTVI